MDRNAPHPHWLGVVVPVDSTRFSRRFASRAPPMIAKNGMEAPILPLLPGPAFLNLKSASDYWEAFTAKKRESMSI